MLKTMMAYKLHESGKQQSGYLPDERCVSDHTDFKIHTRSRMLELSKTTDSRRCVVDGTAN